MADIVQLISKIDKFASSSQKHLNEESVFATYIEEIYEALFHNKPDLINKSYKEIVAQIKMAIQFRC